MAFYHWFTVHTPSNLFHLFFSSFPSNFSTWPPSSWTRASPLWQWMMLSENSSCSTQKRRSGHRRCCYKWTTSPSACWTASHRYPALCESYPQTDAQGAVCPLPFLPDRAISKEPKEGQITTKIHSWVCGGWLTLIQRSGRRGMIYSQLQSTDTPGERYLELCSRPTVKLLSVGVMQTYRSTESCIKHKQRGKNITCIKITCRITCLRTVPHFDRWHTYIHIGHLIWGERAAI